MIQKFIFGYLVNLGLKPALGQGNVWVKIKGKNSNKALIFNSHVDTVGPGELKNWTDWPWSGVIKNGKIFGLGASDEKAGLAALLLLAENLVKHQPAVDVWLMFVVNEEVDGSGTKIALKSLPYQSYQKLAAVLVEPTGLKSVEIGHKGNVFIRLTVKGDSGHGSEPEKIKINSVLTMSRVLLKLEKSAKIWQGKYTDPFLGKPTMGIGTAIKGGDLTVPNKFADTCIVSLDVRTIPSMHQQVFNLIKAALVQFPVKVEYLYPPAPFGLTDKNEAIVKSIKALKPDLKIITSSGSTDQCWFSQAKIPAIIFGPGEEDQAHKPNEWCYFSKIYEAVEIYNFLILKWGKMK